MGRAVEHDDGGVHVGARRLDCDHRAAGDLPRHQPRSADGREHQLPALDDHGLPAGPGRARGDRRPARRHVRPGQDLQRRLRRVHSGVDPAVVRSVHGRPRRSVADRVAGGAGARRVDAHRELGRDPHRRVPRRPARVRARHQPGGGDRRPVHRPGRGRGARRDRLARRVLGERARRRVRNRVGLLHAARHRRATPRPDRLVGQHHVRDRLERDPDRRDQRHQAVRRSRDGLDQPGGDRLASSAVPHCSSRSS